MIGKILAVSVSLFLVACTSEKVNISPLPANIQPNTVELPSYSERVKTINNTSEITNLLSTMPQFSKASVNQEIATLKSNLELYIYAVEAYNKAGEQRNIHAFEKSYQKLQGLKTSLTENEQETLNRYLVRIKTSVSQVERRAAAN